MKPGIECALTGRLGQVPELRHVRGGELALLRLSVAVGDDEDVQWVSVACWGDRAEALDGTLATGDRVYVEGAIRLNEYEGKDGTKRTQLQVSATLVQPLGQIGKRRPRKLRKPGTSRPVAVAEVMSAEAEPFNDELPAWMGADD